MLEESKRLFTVIENLVLQERPGYPLRLYIFMKQR